MEANYILTNTAFAEDHICFPGQNEQPQNTITFISCAYNAAIVLENSLSQICCIRSA